MCAESLLQASVAERQAWATEAVTKADASGKEEKAGPAAAAAAASGNDPCPPLLAQFFFLVHKIVTNIQGMMVKPLIVQEKELRLARFSVCPVMCLIECC